MPFDADSFAFSYAFTLSSPPSFHEDGQLSSATPRYAAFRFRWLPAVLLYFDVSCLMLITLSLIFR